MINKSDFLVRVAEIAAEEPSYRRGGSGKDGTCDCIGLIIGAIRRAGGSWTGTHGSNYAARYEMIYLKQIKNSSELTVGEVVYKSRAPGDDKYDLPPKYTGADRLDYYHAGVVMSVSPLRIQHMTTPKPMIDTKLGKWQWRGWLKKIDRTDEGGGTSMPETVIISGGNPGCPINMRSGKSTDYKIIKSIPQGASAELIEAGDKWSKIKYAGTTGYVSSVFVKSPGNTTPAANTNENASSVTIQRAELEKIYDTIGDWLGLRG